jgi:hypothetical protein
MSFNRKRVALLFVAVAISLNACVSAELLDGLIAYWPLDESSGTNAPDVIGSHDGTLTTTSISWTAGKLDNAVDCYGSDFGSGYINIPQHSALKPANISIQAWVSLDAFGDWDGIVGNFEDTGDTESGWALFTHGTNTVSWYVSVAGSMRWTSVSVPTAQWTHLVGTYDGTNVKLYMNAAAPETTYAPGSIDYSEYPPISMRIGQYYDSNEQDALDGRVDEVALWNRALTLDEVQMLYNGGAAHPVTGGVYVYVTESGGSTSVTEGDLPDTYEVVLHSEPSDDVQITATPSDNQIDLGEGPGNPLTLTFAKNKWDTPQTITVTAYDDDIYEGEEPHETTIAHSASGAEYTGINIAPVQVSVTDNELTCGDWGYYQTDLNEDCYVTLLDFALFAEQWLASGPQ